jgi:MFS family permease
MKQPRRAVVLPATTAAIVLAIMLAATAWAAKPLYDPLQQEFRWSPGALALVAAVSALVTLACLPWALTLARRRGVRPVTTAGALGAGVVALLVVPNLTHLWQLAATLALIGIGRAAVCAGAWRELARTLGPWGAGLAVLAALASSVAGITPWIAEVVYRNSWREGAAACGGILIVLASPLAYVLLPGREVEPRSA